MNVFTKLAMCFAFHYLYTSFALLVHFSPASVGKVYLRRKVKVKVPANWKVREQKSPFQPVKKGEVQGESSIGELAGMDVGVDQARHDELVLVQPHHPPLLAQLLLHSILVSACVSTGRKGFNLSMFVLYISTLQ